MSKEKLTLILGPMYSGKTTTLINLINKSDNHIAYKHNSDDRYQMNSIISHDNKAKKCIPVANISEILKDVDKYNNIFIDEGQFFTDLYENVKILIAANKSVFISGLDGDFKQEPFGNGDLLKLIPFADEIIMLKSKCYICSNDARFTKRLVNDNEQILIGSNKLYQPVCRIHLNSK